MYIIFLRKKKYSMLKRLLAVFKWPSILRGGMPAQFKTYPLNTHLINNMEDIVVFPT